MHCSECRSADWIALVKGKPFNTYVLVYCYCLQCKENDNLCTVHWIPIKATSFLSHEKGLAIDIKGIDYSLSKSFSK